MRLSFYRTWQICVCIGKRERNREKAREGADLYSPGEGEAPRRCLARSDRCGSGRNGGWCIEAAIFNDQREKSESMVEGDALRKSILNRKCGYEQVY